MTYMIDAWLDRPQPYLQIINRNTGKVCARLEGALLEELFRLGDIDTSTLCCTEPRRLKELVRELFLFCHAQSFRSASPQERVTASWRIETPRPSQHKTMLAPVSFLSSWPVSDSFRSWEGSGQAISG